MTDPTPEEMARFLAAIEDVLTEDERRADEEAAAELRAMGAHAHEVTTAVLTRAWEVKKMRAQKAGRHPARIRPRGGIEWSNGRANVPALGRQANEMLEWLADDLAAGVELLGGTE